MLLHSTLEQDDLCDKSLETIAFFFFSYIQSYIPKTLDHVRNAEEDVQRITSGRDTGDMYYQKITGLTEALSISHASVAEKQLQEEEHVGGEDAEKYSVSDRHGQLENGSCDETGSDEDDDGESTDSEEQNSSSENDQPTAMDRKALRKENKKRVKEEKREARKHKVPKAVKKKKKKLAKAKKYR